MIKGYHEDEVKYNLIFSFGGILGAFMSSLVYIFPSIGNFYSEHSFFTTHIQFCYLVCAFLNIASIVIVVQILKPIKMHNEIIEVPTIVYEKRPIIEYIFPTIRLILDQSNNFKFLLFVYSCDFGNHWLVLISISQMYPFDMSFINGDKTILKHWDFQASVGSFGVLIFFILWFIKNLLFNPNYKFVGKNSYLILFSTYLICGGTYIVAGLYFEMLTPCTLSICYGMAGLTASPIIQY